MCKRKIAASFLTVVCALLFAACGSNAANGADAQEAAAIPRQKELASKAIVVYYSATGRTKEAAEAVAAAVRADIFALEPQEPYTDADLNYRDEGSRVVREHNDPARHTSLVQETPVRFADADVIFLGYPIWWGDASWVVEDFVRHNDFTGKTVIPFATSYSSPLGASAEHLAEIAGTGNWQEGICFDQGMTKEKVMDWAKSLHLNAMRQ